MYRNEWSSYLSGSDSVSSCRILRILSSVTYYASFSFLSILVLKSSLPLMTIACICILQAKQLVNPLDVYPTSVRGYFVWLAHLQFLFIRTLKVYVERHFGACQLLHGQECYRRPINWLCLCNVEIRGRRVAIDILEFHHSFTLVTLLVLWKQFPARCFAKTFKERFNQFLLCLYDW